MLAVPQHEDDRHHDAINEPRRSSKPGEDRALSDANSDLRTAVLALVTTAHVSLPWGAATRLH